MKYFCFAVMLVLLQRPVPFAAESATDESHDTVLTRIAFGSCCNVRQYPKQAIWQGINAVNPDLWIWLGDIVYNDKYPDSKTPEGMWAHYLLQQQQPGYRRLLESAAVVGVWDDHDYGKNNGGKEYQHKEHSQQMLLDFLDVAKDSPRRERKGAYSSFDFGVPEKLVRVILLDVRYHRENRQKENADILGAEQWAWLEQQLQESPAQLHIIGSGIQFLSPTHRWERWGQYPWALEKLHGLLQKHQPPGVVLISGDRHIGEFACHKDAPIAYPLYEVTSSGMTHPWTKASDEANAYRVGGAMYQDKHFAMITIDWENAALQLSINDTGGKAQRQLDIALEDLRAP